MRARRQTITKLTQRALRGMVHLWLTYVCPLSCYHILLEIDVVRSGVKKQDVGEKERGTLTRLRNVEKGRA